MDKNTVTWDFDLKRILLNELYDESYPIKNILNSKLYSRDSPNDYSVHHQGHVENYRYVEDVFNRLYPNGQTQHKDVMNSFWTTYKHYLQIEYPHIFMPDGKLSNPASTWSQPLPSQQPDTSYPPFSYGKNQTVGQAYTEYYAKHFPHLHVDPNDTWFEFLLNNYDHFSRVHDDFELNTFATRTHTIGNICVVLKGFNAGRNAADYWDFAMQYMKDFMDTFGGWQSFVDTYELTDYVSAVDYSVIPFWKNHLSNDPSIPYHPQTKDDIQQFLSTVNQHIKHRGQRMVNTYNITTSNEKGDK